MLAKDAIRKISVMLPCRVSVYKDKAGKTKVAIMDMTALVGMLGPKAEKVMIKASEGLADIIAKATRK